MEGLRLVPCPDYPSLSPRVVARMCVSRGGNAALGHLEAPLLTPIYPGSEPASQGVIASYHAFRRILSSRILVSTSPKP
ncbi:unnamed protein product [Protopolystoma xenopodis]|uniref:Uncharacterized protein n=1 Tax=Protopolystoma xenopodis TaxID=117903 RepID=A0A3S5CII7_9PLAT|nr:unnamed protein product [Protopolystoma xenopodis]